MILNEYIGAKLIKKLSNLVNIKICKNIYSSEVSNFLDTFIEILSESINNIKNLNKECQTEIFCNNIRKYLVGWKNNELLCNRLTKYIRGIVTQSTLIQLYDILLNIDHKQYNDFFKEMRKYMSRKHKNFLEYIESLQLHKLLETNNK